MKALALIEYSALNVEGVKTVFQQFSQFTVCSIHWGFCKHELGFFQMKIFQLKLISSFLDIIIELGMNYIFIQFKYFMFCGVVWFEI